MDLTALQRLHPEWRLVDVTQAPGGGLWALGADGGVFALDAQGNASNATPFHGAYTTLSEAERQGDRQGFKRIQATPNGGYSLTSGRDEQFAFGPKAPAAPQNVLAEDPAWLAFLRTSGLEYDQAAADMSRRSAAINTALGLDIPEIEEQGKQARRGIDNSFAARGVFESTARKDRLGEQEAQQTSQIGRRRLDAVNQVGGLEGDLAGTVAGIQRRGAEMGSSIAGNNYGSELERGLAQTRSKYDDDLASLNRQRLQYGS